MAKNTLSAINVVEMQEVIQKLRNAGYSDLVDCLLDNERECYTKRGRLNKSSTCRKLEWKSKKLEDALKTMKDILRTDFEVAEEIEED
jgi:hypothetical protein